MNDGVYAVNNDVDDAVMLQPPLHIITQQNALLNEITCDFMGELGKRVVMG